MRFKRPVPKDGEERVVTKFLWLPKNLNQEMRWLEKAKWRQRAFHFTNGYGYFYEWRDVSWEYD